MFKLNKILLLCLALMLNLGAFSQKKVVFIIVDGIAEDMLDSIETPNFDRIQQEGIMLPAFVGGDKGTYNQTPTISAVGYNSLLTGVWYNKHNVYGNNDQKPNYNYPTVFRLFKDQYPEKKIAVFSSWEDNRTVLIGEGLDATEQLKIDYSFDGLEKDQLQFPHDNEANYIKMIDYLVAEKASDYILEEAPDLSWVYLEHTDDVAHKYGNSDILWENIKFEDELVGRIYDAVKKREKEHGEDWLFIVTTDHGRQADGHNHGGQSDRERNTWILLNKKKVNQYAQSNRVAVTDLAPTILDFLNVTPPESIQEEMDGINLIKESPVYHLKSSQTEDDKITLSWETIPHVKGKGEVFMTNTNNFKTGGKDQYTRIGKVRLDKKEYVFKNKLGTSDIFKIILRVPDGQIYNTWIKKE